MKNITVLLFTLLLIPFKNYAQQNLSIINFSAIDSFARTVKYEDNIDKLTKDLATPYTEDILKVRAIFIWITDNIKYDYEFVNEGKTVKGPNCDGVRDCSEIYRVWELDYLNKVCKKKKGVCDGYARLFKKMCDISGIKSEIVSGYTKLFPYQVGNPSSVNHSWNAVSINHSYQFLDATWAAGKCTQAIESEKLVSFKKEYENYYWLTPFKKLVRNHYPQDSQWVNDHQYTKEIFFNTPFYDPTILSKIDLLSPNTGMLYAKKGDTIHFKFTYDDTINFIQANSNVYRVSMGIPWVRKPEGVKLLTNDTTAIKKQKFIPFKHTGNYYEFDYLITDESIYYVEILFDFRMALKFKLKIESV